MLISPPHLVVAPRLKAPLCENQHHLGHSTRSSFFATNGFMVTGAIVPWSVSSSHSAFNGLSWARPRPTGRPRAPPPAQFFPFHRKSSRALLSPESRVGGCPKVDGGGRRWLRGSATYVRAYCCERDDYLCNLSLYQDLELTECYNTELTSSFWN